MKVVSPAEMGRIEALAYQEEESDAAFMEAAGKAVATSAMRRGSRFTIICGKGNNGGDGLVAARYLYEKGCIVDVYLLAREGSPLFQKQLAAYKGQTTVITNVDEIFLQDVVITALFGTGFKGALEGLPLALVQKVNRASVVRLALDIPAGLNGETGEVVTEALKAHLTVTLGLPKSGFFRGQGFEYIGELEVASFGLPAKFIQQARADFELFVEGESQIKLPGKKRTWHKYQRGYVMALAGSPAMMGAAALTTKAALRSGSGIVRLITHRDRAAALYALPHEVLACFIEENLEAELQRASSLLVGPGIGRDDDAALQQVMALLKKPVVIDADALWWLAKKAFIPPPGAVLTPHQQEMARLGESPQAYADRHDVIIVLKGAPTIIYAKQRLPLIVAKAPAAMATAGSGDVLTGVIASLLAQGLAPYDAAVTGVYFHSLAGLIAFQKKNFGAIASDFVEALPEVLKKFPST